MSSVSNVTLNLKNVNNNFTITFLIMIYAHSTDASQ